jgi:hypothetical protein
MNPPHNFTRRYTWVADPDDARDMAYEDYQDYLAGDLDDDPYEDES